MRRTVWNLLGKYLPHRTARFATLGVLSIVAGVLEAAVIVLTVRAAIAIADGGDHVTASIAGLGRESIGVAGLLWTAAGACVLAAIVGIVTARMTARIASDALATTRAAALEAFSRASWHEQALSREGALQEAVTNNAMQASELSISVSKALTYSMNLIALLAVALAVSALATLAVIGLGLVIVLVLRPVTQSTRRRATRFVASNARFAEAVAEESALALEMRVFGVELAETDRLTEVSRAAAHEGFLTRYSSFAGVAIYRTTTLLFLIGVVAGLYAAGGVNLSAVGTVVVIMVRALSYAQQAQSYTQRINEVEPNLVALDRTIVEFGAVAEHFGNVRTERVGPVLLRQVSYSYGDQPALRGLDLEIAPGEQLGIVGPSGGGKSTLVQVLLRLRLPTTGTVLVDGRPYEEIAPESWANLVSVVPQEPRLFAGSVADNIAFHRTGLTREQIEEAAARAHIADEIRELPGGFDARLTARGGGLSGGQRQRLAIARALVGEPELLVLDEPTSALDVHSERLLQATIRELTGRVTMVIVAHRLSTIAACERLLVLERGEIVALGPYDEVQRHPFLKRAAGDLPPSRA